jgi:hypothetical protein
MTSTFARPDSPTTATAYSVAVGLWSAQREGLERLKQLIEPSPFTFVVNGRSFVTTVIDAVLLSPAVFNALIQDPTITTFAFDVDGRDCSPALLSKLFAFPASG